MGFTASDSLMPMKMMELTKSENQWQRNVLQI